MSWSLSSSTSSIWLCVSSCSIRARRMSSITRSLASRSRESKNQRHRFTCRAVSRHDDTRHTVSGMLSNTHTDYLYRPSGRAGLSAKTCCRMIVPEWGTDGRRDKEMRIMSGFESWSVHRFVTVKEVKDELTVLSCWMVRSRQATSFWRVFLAFSKSESFCLRTLSSSLMTEIFRKNI